MPNHQTNLSATRPTSQRWLRGGGLRGGRQASMLCLVEKQIQQKAPHRRSLRRKIFSRRHASSSSKCADCSVEDLSALIPEDDEEANQLCAIKSNREHKYQSWKQNLFERADEGRRRTLHGSKNGTPLMRSERQLGGDTPPTAVAGGESEERLSGFLDDFLSAGYQKRVFKSGDAMELDLSPMQHARSRESSDDKLTSRLQPHPPQPHKPAQRPVLSPAAKAQSKRNLVLERYIEENAAHLPGEHHHRHDGHKGSHSVVSRRSRRASALIKKATLARETTC